MADGELVTADPQSNFRSDEMRNPKGATEQPKKASDHKRDDRKSVHIGTNVSDVIDCRERKDQYGQGGSPEI